MAAGFRPYLRDSNLTNSEAPGISMSVIHSSEQQPLHSLPAIYYHPQTAVLPSVQFSHPYHQYLSQFAPNFVPYYYRLLARPIMKREEMDIENYINREVANQQATIRQRSLRPLGQLQPLMQPPPVQQQIPIKVPRREVRRISSPPKRRIINAQLVAIATPSGGIKNIEPQMEPLPPVEDSFKQQVAKVQKSQHHYEQLFGRLASMLKTLNQRYDKDCTDVPAPPSKRPRNMSTSSAESQLPDNNASENERQSNLVQYPQRVLKEDGSTAYILGPNGTEITAHQYGEVFFTNAPVATRCLLCVVFSSDELATHTLTGKPSPAFYGRERPPKLQLDQRKVDDIVLSVMNRTGGKERVIRATITTKCADTAKKYKRRAKKAQKMAIKEEC